MNETIKELLVESYQHCKDDNRTFEYTVEYMMDYADVGRECVINFLKGIEDE